MKVIELKKEMIVPSDKKTFLKELGKALVKANRLALKHKNKK